MPPLQSSPSEFVCFRLAPFDKPTVSDRYLVSDGRLALVCAPAPKENWPYFPGLPLRPAAALRRPEPALAEVASTWYNCPGRSQSMATEIPELDAFFRFAQRKLRDGGTEISLEEVLREFREQENWTPRSPLGQQLQELRQQFIAEGGKLLTADEVAAEVRERRGKTVPAAIEQKAKSMDSVSRAEQLKAVLCRQHQSLAVAESCTGGLLGATITAVSGSSDYFSGGIIAYSNMVKHQLLGVEQDTLERFGAVSAECAEALVAGLGRLFHCDIGISVTGIAGPGGGSRDKPVGLVYAGFLLSGHIFVREYRFRGGRDAMRHETVNSVLDEILSRK